MFYDPSALSMTDLLSKLTKQSQVEAREDLRQMVASLNGLAGLHLLRNMVRAAHFSYFAKISKSTLYYCNTVTLYVFLWFRYLYAIFEAMVCSAQ